MKSYTYILSFAIFLHCLFNFNLYAKQIELDSIMSIAGKVVSGYSKNSSFRQGRENNTISSAGLTLAYTATIATNKTGLKKSGNTANAILYYILNFDKNDKQGFLIIAGDDVYTPVIGYSENGHYNANNLPPNFVSWMEGVKENISYAINNNIPQAEKIALEWKSLSTPDYYEEKVVSSPYPSDLKLPLTTKWNQGAPYNQKCPLDQGIPTYTGCVATAMAQLMKFYNYPSSGTGQSAAYITRTKHISVPSVNFGNEIYDWGNMTNNYSGVSTDVEKEAVSTLMYHAGASVQMDYTSFESGTYSSLVPLALTNYFKYDKGIQRVEKIRYSDEEWNDILKKEIYEGRPVYYDGSSLTSGHAFVCMGYNSNNLFYFNWGWGSYLDGYYALTNMVYSFNYNQTAIIGITPDSGGQQQYCLNLLDSLTISDSVVDHLKNFSVNSKLFNSGWNNIPANFSGGVALVDESDSIILILKQDKYPMDLPAMYMVSFNRTCSIPSSVPAGNYYIRVVTKTGSSNNWVIARSRKGYPGKQPIRITRDVPTDLKEDNIKFVWKGGSNKNFAIRANTGEKFFVNWGDGTTDIYTGSGSSTDISLSHSYSTANNYSVTISDSAITCYFSYLNVSSKQIDSLDITKATKLEYLDCSDNQLTNLDLSKTIYLNTIFLQDNNIKNLDLSKNSELQKLTCAFNKLNSLNLDSARRLNYVYCANNSIPLADIYTISLKNLNSTNIHLGTQILDTTYSMAGVTIVVDSVFNGTNTTFNVFKNGSTALATDYSSNNGRLTFETTGFYSVETTNPAIISSALYPAKVINHYSIGYSKDATLSNIIIDTGILTPAFSSAITNYTVTVSNKINSIILTAVKNYQSATVTGDGVKMLSEGANTFNITVTAEDGTTTKTYRVVVIRPPSNDATLSNLTVSAGTLTPAFNSATINYTVNVANNISSITLTATAKNLASTFTGDGTKILNTGANTFNIVVTSEDSTTTKTYTVVVMRAKSNDATLSNLTVSAGTLTPAFNTATRYYTVNVANNINSITLTATPKISAATITGDGTKSLSIGLNTFPIAVKSEDNSVVNFYTVNVSRATQPVTLTNFSLNSNDGVTTDSSVQLSYTFTGGEPTHFMVSENSNLTGAIWQVYNASALKYNFVSSENGPRRVYTKLKNELGETTVLSDDIYYKTGPVKLKLTAFKLIMGLEGRNVILSHNVENGTPEMYSVSEDSTKLGKNWLTYTTTPIYHLSKDSGVKKVYFAVSNAAGISNILSDKITVNDQQLPLSKVEVYPIPAVTYIKVKLNENITSVNVMLRDISGKIYTSKIFTGSSFIIDVSNYPAGSYFLTITNGKNSISKQIIKL